MKKFVITKTDDGIRLNRFLERIVPSLPASLMYRYLRLKRIKVNGKKCEASARLNAGDELELYINDDFFEQERALPDFMKAARRLDVAYEDDKIAVICKPAGIFCHSVYEAGSDTLVNRFLRYLYENGEYTPDASASFVPSLCNRLDHGTEGLVLAAKTSEAARAVNNAIKHDRIKKTYLCAAWGKAPKEGVYTAYLTKDEPSNTATVADRPSDGAKEIVTAFRPLAVTGKLALLEVGLITGRSHQIRAHLAFLGCPVIGDAKYGSTEINRRYRLPSQALCSYKLEFEPDAEADGAIYYLDKKVVETDKVSFLEALFPGFKI
jgi:Pseudouridylate synthases, 23S RNA-specific